jgi:hypothetical protein
MLQHPYYKLYVWEGVGTRNDSRPTRINCGKATSLLLSRIPSVVMAEATAIRGFIPGNLDRDVLGKEKIDRV